MEEVQSWKSISTTVTAEGYSKISRVAEAEGIKVGTLLRRAVNAYCSCEVQTVASSFDVDVEQLIKKAAVLFLRVNSGKQEHALRDRVFRLELWMERLFFQLLGRNEVLLRQTRVDIEHRLKAFLEELAAEDKEFKQTILDSAGREKKSVPTVPTRD